MCQAVSAGNTFGSKERNCPPAGSYVISTRAYVIQIRKSCPGPEVRKSQGTEDEGMGGAEAGAQTERAVRAGFTAQVQVRDQVRDQVQGPVARCVGVGGKGAGGGTAAAEARESGGSGDSWRAEVSGVSGVAREERGGVD